MNLKTFCFVVISRALPLLLKKNLKIQVTIIFKYLVGAFVVLFVTFFTS